LLWPAMLRCALLLVVFVSCAVAASSNFTVNPAVFSTTSGAAYTQYAWASYCPSQNIKSWDCFWCGYNKSSSTFSPTAVIYNNSTNILAYVGVNDYLKQNFVVFRGGQVNSTANIQQLDDYTYINPYDPYVTEGVYVQRGTYLAYQSISNQVLNAVGKIYEDDDDDSHFPLVVVGHSLGGALGTYFALDAKLKLSITPYLWTIGSIRVGNEAFVEYFANNVPSSNSFRCENSGDFAPLLPPQYLGYTGIPTEYWFYNNTWIECSNVTEDESCSASLGNQLVNATILNSLAVHFNYFGLKGGDQTCFPSSASSLSVSLFVFVLLAVFVFVH